MKGRQRQANPCGSLNSQPNLHVHTVHKNTLIKKKNKYGYHLGKWHPWLSSGFHICLFIDACMTTYSCGPISTQMNTNSIMNIYTQNNFCSPNKSSVSHLFIFKVLPNAYKMVIASLHSFTVYETIIYHTVHIIFISLFNLTIHLLNAL